MAVKRKLAVLIPIILDLGVLLIFPTLIDELGLNKAIILGIIAFLAPWIPFAIISCTISHEIKE
ncbi:MAG: hypothetical protein AB1746_04860, partial [Candidatus Zixiibacteriota bacterium]